MNIVRKPESQRGPQLARRAKATAAGMRVLGRLPGVSAGGRRGSRHQHQRALADAGVDPRRQPDRPAPWPRRTRRRRSAATTPGRPSTPGSASGRRHGGADDPRQRDPGVGLHQGQARRDESGYGGGARDAVRLGRHQAAEGGGEQPARVGRDGRGQHPAQEGPDRHRGADGPAAAVAEAVEERADQRRDDRERQHRQREEQRDLTARLTGRDLEEQRAGERDRDGRVTGGVEGVQPDQLGEAGLAGALGPGGAPRLAAVYFPARAVTRVAPATPRPDPSTGGANAPAGAGDPARGRLESVGGSCSEVMGQSCRVGGSRSCSRRPDGRAN